MWKLSPILLALLPFVSTAAFAHAGHQDLERAELSWSFEPWVLVSLTVCTLAYISGLRRMRARAREQIGATEIWAFVGGIAALLIALQSPLDAVSQDLFSAHMVQHLTLMLVAAPLFVVSRPLIVFLWSMPPRTRKTFGRIWARGRLGGAFAFLTSPAFVWIAFCGLFAFWHLPGPYARALQHEGIHIFEHVCFYVSAFAFWSVVIEPSGRPRLDYGGRLLFVATAAVLSGLPGALMVLTSRPFYALHAAGAARWGLTPIEDQHLAGLIMWIPAGFAYIGAILILFVRWMQAAELRSAARLERMQRLARLAPALCLFALLGGCKDDALERTARADVDFGGNPANGVRQIASIGCGSCHIIPGVTGAVGLVGPPLNHMGRRVFIAGLLRNTPDNMMLWLRNPQQIVPGNAMPNMGLNESQARDITAYLYTLN